MYFKDDDFENDYRKRHEFDDDDDEDLGPVLHWYDVVVPIVVSAIAAFITAHAML